MEDLKNMSESELCKKEAELETLLGDVKLQILDKKYTGKVEDERFKLVFPADKDYFMKRAAEERAGGLIMLYSLKMLNKCLKKLSFYFFIYDKENDDYPAYGQIHLDSTIYGSDMKYSYCYYHSICSKSDFSDKSFVKKLDKFSKSCIEYFLHSVGSYRFKNTNMNYDVLKIGNVKKVTQ